MARLTNPATRGFSVTPHDTDPLVTPSRGLYIGGAGDIVVRFKDNDIDTTLINVAAGTIHPIQCTHIRATGTTATDIVAVV